MKSNFNTEFFASNRRRLRQAVSAAHPDTENVPIVIAANGLLQRGGDNTFPFHQDSNFWYLTGTDEPDLALVMTGDDEYLILPARSASREAFDGAVDVAELSNSSGIQKIIGSDDGYELLVKILKKAQPGNTERIATPAAPPAYIEQIGMFTNPARTRLAEHFRTLAPDAELMDIRQILAVLRMIKQPEEITALRQAIQITSESLQLLTEPDRFSGYKNEYEVEADLSREFRFRGAAGHAFAPIIAGGKRACTLHNISNEAPLQKDNLIILDVGAEVSHYAADITRTRAYGKPTARQQQVFDAVLDVQSYALSLLKPGAVPKEYEQAVETYMGRTLQRLKLIQTADHDSIRRYYPHSTSHFLGLDVHDVGDYSQPLQAGVVLTCEPGIYIPEEGIGVRLEDDVLITADGHEVMSSALSKSL